MDGELPDPYIQFWRSLTPGERLKRSWKLRRHVKNLRAVHDAKTYPEL